MPYAKLGDRTRQIMPYDQDEQVRVKQSQKDECDINKIMERYRNGGELQHINKVLGQYGDFSSGQDFSDACLHVAKAEAAFAELPAYARAAMGNDPKEFLHRMEDPEQLKKWEQLALYDPDAGPIVEPEPPKPAEPEPSPEG